MLFDACEAGIDRLNLLYSREAKVLLKKGIAEVFTIAANELAHLSKMVQNEIKLQGDIGLGPNGLGSVFSSRIKGFKEAVSRLSA